MGDGRERSPGRRRASPGRRRPRDALAAAPGSRNVLRGYFFLAAADLGEHVTGVEDQEVLALDGDLGAAVLRVDDDVADGDVERDQLAGVLGATAGTDGEDFALLGLLLGGVGDDEAAHRGLFGLRRSGRRCGPRGAADSCGASWAWARRSRPVVSRSVSTRRLRVLTTSGNTATPARARVLTPASATRGAAGSAELRDRDGAAVERGRAVGARGATTRSRRSSPRCRCRAPVGRRSTRPPPVAAAASATRPAAASSRRPPRRSRAWRAVARRRAATSFVDEHVDHRLLERRGDVGAPRRPGARRRS